VVSIRSIYEQVRSMTTNTNGDQKPISFLL
jgi:hypothetical protein